jgi:hypothetical protein
MVWILGSPSCKWASNANLNFIGWWAWLLGLVGGVPGLRVLSRPRWVVGVATDINWPWWVMGSVTHVNRACWLLGLAADVKLAFVGGGSGC